MPNSNPTLTSANADITLAIPGIFTSPQQILGFSADNIYEIINQINVKKVDGR